MKSNYSSLKKFIGKCTLGFLIMLYCSLTSEAQLVNVPGTSVSLIPPKHFELTDLYKGFIHKPSNSSIAVAKVEKTNYLAFRKNLNKEYFATQKLTLISKEEIKTAHMEGVLYHLSFTVQNVEMERFMLVTGDYNDTYVVMSNYPSMFKSQVRDLIKSSLKTVRYK